MKYKLWYVVGWTLFIVGMVMGAVVKSTGEEPTTGVVVAVIGAGVLIGAKFMLWLKRP